MNTFTFLCVYDMRMTADGEGKHEHCWAVPTWTFSLRGVLTFVAMSLDINGCVLSYFEGTENVHCYTSCTLPTLHCSKVLFFSVVT